MEEKQTVTVSDEYQLVLARQEAQFMATPAGQMVKTFEIQQRMAEMFAASDITPQQFKKNKANCIIALDMAQRMGVNPLMVMQNMYVVYGQPSFSSKFLIATINASGRFSPLHFEFKGDDAAHPTACRCIAYERSDKKHQYPLAGEWITMEMAKAEGWLDRKESKWQTMPAQMMRYRAAAFWQRTYCPEISMGFLTREEVEDIQGIQDVEWEEMPKPKRQRFTNIINEIKNNDNETATDTADTAEVTDVVS